MVQFFNPPPSAFSGNLPVRTNPIARAIQFPAAIDRRARAMQEILAASNPAFASLSKDRQFASARNIVVGDPSVRLEASRLRPSGPFQVLDKDGNPTGQIGHESEPFSTALQNQRQEALQPAIDPGDQLSTGRAIGRALKQVGPKKVEQTGSLVRGADEAIRELAGLPPLAENDPGLLLEAGKPVADAIADAVLGPAPNLPSGQIKRSKLSQRFFNIRKAVRAARRIDPSIDRAKFSPTAIRRESQKRGVPISQVLKEVEEVLGIDEKPKKKPKPSRFPITIPGGFTRTR